MWAGETVAILASGPSMSQAVADDVRARGLPAIAINSTFRLAPWAAMLYAADPAWWEHRSNVDAHQFAGLRVSCMRTRGVLYLHPSGRDGFDPDPAALRHGGNSGYQALHIAVAAGAARVELHGFDMRGCHWHGPHPEGLLVTQPEHYAKWIASFDGLAPLLRAIGVEVVNRTPGSALTCFPMETECRAH